MNSEIGIGRSFPLGATIVEGGANFSLFSRRATGVELLFFDSEEDTRPSRVVPMDSAANRTYHYWHVFVPSVRARQIYGYRVQPFDPARGMRFDDSKVLLDPCGRPFLVQMTRRTSSAELAFANGKIMTTRRNQISQGTGTYKDYDLRISCQVGGSAPGPPGRPAVSDATLRREASHIPEPVNASLRDSPR